MNREKGGGVERVGDRSWAILAQNFSHQGGDPAQSESKTLEYEERCEVFFIATFPP